MLTWIRIEKTAIQNPLLNQFIVLCTKNAGSAKCICCCSTIVQLKFPKRHFWQRETLLLVLVKQSADNEFTS